MCTEQTGDQTRTASLTGQTPSSTMLLGQLGSRLSGPPWPRGVGGGRQQRLCWGAQCRVLGERAWAGKHLGLGVLSRATRPLSAGSAQLPASFPRAGRLLEKSLSGHQQPWAPLPQGDHVPHGLCANLWVHWSLWILTTKKSASLWFPKPTDTYSCPPPGPAPDAQGLTTRCCPMGGSEALGVRPE